MNFQVTLTNEDKETIAKMVSEQLKDELIQLKEPAAAEPKEKKLITRQQLSETYGISLPTITKMTNSGRLTYILAGEKKMLFDPMEVEKALSVNNKIKTCRSKAN
jgi:hypothetical protein